MSPLSRELRDTSARLFAEKGFAGTSIRDIASELGVTSAALYHYMGSKEELLADLILELVQRIRAVAEPLVAETQTPEAALVVLVRIDVLFTCRNPTLTIVWENEMRSLGDEARARMMPVYDEYRALWLRVIEQGYEEQVFRGYRPRTSLQALKALCSGVARWYTPADELTPEQVADDYAQMALNLLRAQRDGLDLDLDSLDVPPVAWFSQLVERMVENDARGRAMAPVTPLAGEARSTTKRRRAPAPRKE